MIVPELLPALDAPLPPMDTAGRLDRLRAGLVGADALVVASLTNVRYLTGFTGSAGMLFVFPDEAVLLTDGRYAQQSEEQLAAAAVSVRVEIAPGAAQAERAGDLVRAARPARLGLEAGHISWARALAMAASWFPGVDLVPTEGIVESLRRVKDDGELARLGRAAAIADHALAAVRTGLGDGPTEVELGLALDTEMRRLGASAPSFDTIVASGPNAAKPHHRPTDRVILAGEPVVLDFGALYDGYCSDMTRTVWVGELTDPELGRAVRVVAAAQAAGVAAVAPGVACAEVDTVCREVIAAAGWADRFVHGTGHGVGLDIHEAPSVAASSTDTLERGHVVTVEPGIYLPGHGGVRIEDTVVVTSTGCTPLTNTPKERC
jgi:Xaa-Pro aminopeptidase